MTAEQRKARRGWASAVAIHVGAAQSSAATARQHLDRLAEETGPRGQARIEALAGRLDTARDELTAALAEAEAIAR